MASSIRHVGPTAARALASRFGSISEIHAAPVDELADTEGVDPVIAQSLKLWSEADWHADTAEAWIAIEVRMADELSGPGDDGRLSATLEGLTMAVTGSLEGLTRNGVKEVIISQGGKAVGSVSRKTNCVVMGENTGSKATKAEELGLPILDEAGFLILLEKEPAGPGGGGDATTSVPGPPGDEWPVR